MSDCTNCLQVNGHSLDCAKNVEKFIEEIDTQTKKDWKRPLTPAALEFLLKQTKPRVKCESGRAQIDYMITNLHKKYGFKTESERTLEAAQQKRDERLREMGYDISGDDETDKEPTEAMKETWRKREKNLEEMNRK